MGAVPDIRAGNGRADFLFVERLEIIPRTRAEVECDHGDGQRRYERRRQT
jgi:hypothetical protein